MTFIVAPTSTSTPVTPIRLWKDHVSSVDRHLPSWARRSDPIVKRHLGIYWKILPLEIDLLARIYGVQVGIILASILIPIILPLTFTMLPVSIVMLPFIFAAYGRVLLNIGMFTTRMIVDEQENNTLSLLRTTPIPLWHILVSKAAAGVWRQVEDLSLILMGVALLSLPVIGLQYATYWPLDEEVVFSRFSLVLGLATVIIRVIIEPFMIAAMAILIGSIVPSRIPAITALTATGFFYFLFINLPRLLIMSPVVRVLVEFVLPVVVPLVVIFVCFRLAHAFLTRD